MGGVRDETDTDGKVKGLDDTAVKDLGHHLYFNFNGISFYVDKDGQAALSYNGLTKIDGSTDVDKKNNGTALKLLKNGDARFSDKDNKNGIFIDHQNSKVVVKRDKAFELGDASDKMLLGRELPQRPEADDQRLVDQLPEPADGAAGRIGSAQQRRQLHDDADLRRRGCCSTDHARGAIPEPGLHVRVAAQAGAGQVRAGGGAEEQLPQQEE
jgi:hypothetical protein